MKAKSGLFKNFVSLNESEVYRILKDRIESNEDIVQILEDLQSALFEIGNLFEKEKYFVPDLMFAGEIMKNSNKQLEPFMSKSKLKNKGMIIIGTVFGDVHDIGKNLVVMLLESAGFTVTDLGVDVSPSRFVEEIKKNDAKLLGLSSLLTMSFDAIGNTVREIEKQGLRNKIKIMVGGAPVTELVREKTGCDFYCKDAYEGIQLAMKVYDL